MKVFNFQLHKNMSKVKYDNQKFIEIRRYERFQIKTIICDETDSNSSN